MRVISVVIFWLDFEFFMKAKKYYVRFLDKNETGVYKARQLLDLILDYNNWPMRVVPLDSDGNPVHESDFLVGDDYSLSFLFVSNDF